MTVAGVGGFNPSFGSMTMGATRAGKAFQTQDMSMISLLNNPQQAGGSEGINDSNKGEYLALYQNMQNAQEAEPKSLYGKLVDYFVTKNLS